MRAFIFSLDAFVAFMVALVAIYSLIFFSSVPSAYYSLLTQAHYLSRDSLLALSTAACDDYSECAARQSSVLDNIVSDRLSPGAKEILVQETVGNMVPEQFGYIVEVSDTEGQGWTQVYNTMTARNDAHAEQSRKLSVSTQVITMGYSGQVRKPTESTFNYLTCGGAGDGTMPGQLADWGTITCGEWSTAGSPAKPLGNIYPGDYMGGALVPNPDVKLVRLTVFI